MVGWIPEAKMSSQTKTMRIKTMPRCLTRNRTTGKRTARKTAATSADARSILAQGGIDLLVLDLTLDGCNAGRDLLVELQPKPCPILIFTAQDESEMYGESWEDLKRLGADDLVELLGAVGADEEDVAALQGLRVLEALGGDGEAFARYVLYQKLAPGYRAIMTNTADSPLMEVFRTFAKPAEAASEALPIAEESTLEVTD